MIRLEDEITHIYQVYLMRVPDKKELKHWISEIESEKISIDDMPNLLKMSDEYKLVHNIPPLENPEYFETSKKKISKQEVVEFLKKRGPVKVQNKTDIQPSVIELLKSLDTKKLLILDLGSNNRRLTENIINVDIVNTNKSTDYVLDICKGLPFENNLFDLVICTAVLEHVAEPIKVVSEIHRVLNHHGLVWADIPFLQPLHRVPTDFQRYTIDGIRYLFRHFEEISSGNANDIGSSMAWILDEFRKVILPKTNNEYLIKVFDTEWEQFKKHVTDSCRQNNLNQSNSALNITGAVYFYGRKSN